MSNVNQNELFAVCSCLSTLTQKRGMLQNAKWSRIEIEFESGGSTTLYDKDAMTLVKDTYIKLLTSQIEPLVNWIKEYSRQEVESAHKSEQERTLSK